MELTNLKTKYLGRDFIFYNQIDSTQNEIFRRIENNNIKNGTLVMADIQTNGKGTNETQNIAFSFYIEVNCSPQKLEGVTIEVAKIIVEIFKLKYNINLNIKEPNDITYNGKKIGGILTQSKIIAKNVKFLVIGIGINTNQTVFLDDIKDGQGAQYVGMGKDLYEKYDEAKKIYDMAEKITNEPIKQISFEGPKELLDKTKYTQLAILTQSLAILEILKKCNINSNLSAGLSLGEYTALIENGIFSFEDGLKIVQKRGEIMQNYTPSGNWKMAAIIGLTEKQVEDVCNKINYFVVPANYNTIGQIVISGEEQGVIEAGELAKQMGAKMVSILNTAGPFHTEKLKECSIKLKKELEHVNIISKEPKVVKNIDGKIYSKSDDISQILSEHIMNPVKFTKVLQTMYDNGIDFFLEIGPGKTLSSFVKRMKFERPIKIMNVGTVNDLEKLIKEVM